jgi:hypothetical protein
VVKKPTYSDDALLRMSQEDLHHLHENAKRLGETELVGRIEGLGVPYGDPAGLKLNSPIGRAIAKIVNSIEGRRAALAATENGRPALEGVDPLLRAALGKKYTGIYEATIQAGYLIAIMMRRLGYEKTGEKPLSVDCFAKTGATYSK